MVALLAKFRSSSFDLNFWDTKKTYRLECFCRIEADDVIIISDATAAPGAETREAWRRLLGAESLIQEEELLAHKEKTYFYLRISEVENKLS